MPFSWSRSWRNREGGACKSWSRFISAKSKIRKNPCRYSYDPWNLIEWGCRNFWRILNSFSSWCRSCWSICKRRLQAKTALLSVYRTTLSTSPKVPRIGNPGSILVHIRAGLALVLLMFPIHNWQWEKMPLEVVKMMKLKVCDRDAKVLERLINKTDICRLQGSLCRQCHVLRAVRTKCAYGWGWFVRGESRE